MCQPLYDMEQLTAFLDRVGKIPVPFLLGVMPLQSYRHAEFLHNELPGVSIPDHLRERMRLAGDQGMQEGIRQSQEFLAAAQGYCDGTYLMPSFGRYEMAELVKVLDQQRWSIGRSADAAGPAGADGCLALGRRGHETVDVARPFSARPEVCYRCSNTPRRRRSRLRSWRAIV